MLTSDLLGLKFSFPNVHGQAELAVQFQHVLRIPDDGIAYPEPPVFGRLPLRHIEDFADRLPAETTKRGGMLIPMYQSDGLRISFLYSDVPMAIKIGIGKRCAVTGREWYPILHANTQDYAVVPSQKSIDGFLVAEGIVRQFVATPLGENLSVEEQLKGIEDVGGVQLLVYPMKRSYFREMQAREAREPRIDFSLSRREQVKLVTMGAGGELLQPIYKDKYGLDAWDMRWSHRCFVTIVNSAQWHAITGESPPHRRLKHRHYREHRIPWYDKYEEPRALRPTNLLRKIKSIGHMMRERSQL